jgi:hypothetical protein
MPNVGRVSLPAPAFGFDCQMPANACKTEQSWAEMSLSGCNWLQFLPLPISLTRLFRVKFCATCNPNIQLAGK